TVRAALSANRWKWASPSGWRCFRFSPATCPNRTTPMIASSTVQRDNRPKRLVNARLFCPKSGLDEIGGLLIEDGRIADRGPHVRQPDGADEFETIDCGGHLL